MGAEPIIFGLSLMVGKDCLYSRFRVMKFQLLFVEMSDLL